MKREKKGIKFMSLVAVFALTACGGGSKGESPREIMSKKDGVFIFYNIPHKMCESKDFQRGMRQKYPNNNLIFQVESNDVTCSTYGKSYPTCRTNSDLDYGDQSCVIGLDISGNYKQNKLSIAHEDILTESIMLLDEVQEAVE